MNRTKANWFKDLCVLVAFLFFYQTILPTAQGLPMPKISWDFGPTAAYAQGPEWLASTVDANYEDRFIQEKLVEIGPGVDAAFAFVRDEIGFEAYTGSLRGARGTMWSEAGNSLDQASLLIALLRAQGIPARYAQGTLTDEKAEELILSMFPVYTSVVGCPAADTPRSAPTDDPELLNEAREHYWVEFEDSTGVIAADPSFSGALIGQTNTSSQDTFYEVPDSLRHRVTVRLKAEIAGGLSGLAGGPKIQVPIEETFNTVELVGKPITLGHFVTSHTPPAMFYGFTSHTYSPYIIIGQNDEDISDDHIIRGEAYQEFFSNFALVNEVLTGLFLELDVASPNGEVKKYERTLVDRLGFDTRRNSGVLSVNVAQIDEPGLTDMDLVTINVLPGLQSADSLKMQGPRIETLQSELEEIQPLVAEIPPSGPRSEEERFLLGKARELIRRISIVTTETVTMAFAEASDRVLAQLEKGYVTKAYYTSPRLLLASTRLDDDLFNVRIDLRKNDLRSVPAPGQVASAGLFFQMARGLMESALESEILTELIGAEPVSLVEVFDNLGDGHAVALITPQSVDDLDTFVISDEAKARISMAAEAGRSIITPTAMVNVNGKETIGWLETDWRTGHTISVMEDGGHQALAEYGAVINNPANTTAGVFIGAALGFTEGNITFLTEFLKGLNEGKDPLALVIKKAKDAVASKIIMSFANKFGTKKFIKSRLSKTSLKPYGLEGIATDLFGCFVKPTAPLTGGDIIEGWNAKKFSQCALQSLIKMGFSALPSAKGSLDIAIFIGTAGGMAMSYGWITRNFPVDPTVFPFLSVDLAPGPDPIEPGPEPALAVQIVSDELFTLPIGEQQVPCVYKVQIQNQGPLPDTVELSFPDVPDGFEIESSLSSVKILPGETSEIGLCLRPVGLDSEGTIPPPGTLLPFSVEVSSVTDPLISATDNEVFNTPEIHGVTIFKDALTVSTTPGNPVSTMLTLSSVGNVSEDISLAIELPAGLSATDIEDPVFLSAGESAMLQITLTPAADTPIGSTLTARITATYGPVDNERIVATQVRVHVVVPGSLPAARASHAATDMGRFELADILHGIATTLTSLYQDPASDLYKSRIIALLDSLAGQLDDPLLTSFTGDIHDAGQAVAESTPDTIEDALNTLTVLFEAFGLVLNKMAAHDFSIELIPNSIEARPGQIGEFLCIIKNLGSETSTIELVLSPLPDGLSGTLSHDQVTLEPGEGTPVEGTQTVIAAITQPTEQLLATGFTITGTVLQEPSIVRTAPGAFTVCRESLTIFQVVSEPAALQVGEYARVSAWISNTINRNREVTAILQVLDDKNDPVVPQISVPVDLNTLTSIVEVDFGNIETIGFDEGLYTLRTEIIDNSGALIAAGEGDLQVGQSFGVNVLATPQSLPPGSGQVATNIQVAANTAKISLDTKIVKVLWVHSSTSASGRLETTGNGGLSIFADVLERSGFMSVQAFEEEITITPEFLSAFDIVVFNGNQRTFTDDEAAAVQAFVEEGGGLLQITGYQLVGEVESDNKIIEPYGMAYGLETIITSSLICMEAHEVTTGVQEIPMMDGHFVMVESPASGVAFDNADNVGAGVAESGFGRVVAFGDENALLNQYVRSLPNRRFFVNIFNWLSGRSLRILDFDTDSEGGTLVEGDVVDTSYSSWGVELAVGTVEEGLPVRSGSVYADYNIIPGNNNLAAGVTPGGSTMIAFHDTRPLLVIFDTPTDFVQFDVIDGDNVIIGYADIYGEDGTVLERWTFNQSGSTSSIISFKRIESDIKYLVFIENGKYADGATIDNFTFSTSNIAAHPLTVVHRIPVSANIYLDENSILPEPFSLEITGDEIILTWRTAFTPDNAMLDFDVPLDLTGLQPGENRIVSTGTTAFLSINETDYSATAPGRTIAVEHILGLDPFVQQTAPGEEAGYTAILTNLKAEQETFEIEVTGLSPGWVYIDSPVVLAAMETRELPLQIRPYSSASEGEREFIVTAQSLTGIRDSVYGRLEVNGLPVVNTDTHGIFMELVPSQGTAGQGTSVTFTVRIVNTGNVSEVLSLSLDLPPGFTGTLTSTTIEVPPGIDNYREVVLAATPPAGTMENSYPFTVSAVSTADVSVTAQTSGTMVVSGFGVDLSMSPVSGAPGSTFQMVVTNTGQVDDTFDISLGGPAGPAAILETDELTLGASASQVVTITLGEIDFAYEGAIDLIAVATSRGDTAVTDSATAEIAIQATQGITAEFDPDTAVFSEPGSGAFLLMVRNTGNTEDAYTATITGTSGPVDASLNGLDGQPCQVIPVFRLPGLATGAILLNASLLDHGEGTVTVTVSSLSSPEVNSSDIATLRTGNQAPVADAGPDQSIRIGESVALVGSGSYDLDEGPSALTYLWTFADKPVDSTLTDADISDAATAIASFTPDALGDYLVALTVSDGEFSDSDEVLIQVLNNPPVADAGPDRNVETGIDVTLDGSVSFDPDEDLITYEWSLDAKPSESTLTDGDIEGRNRPDPTFLPDADGLYVFRLIVSDGWSESGPDYVEITAMTPNIVPNANAGEDQTAYAGARVTLDGSGSNDPDGGSEPLTYLWTFKELPPESTLGNDDIFDVDEPQASFMPDVAGTYIVNLSIYDGEDSDEDEVVIVASYRNVPPNANAGANQDVTIGDEVFLDGSASDDPDSGPESFSFTWTFVSLPDESALTNADIFDADTASPGFTPDVVRSYVLQLEVFDGADSDIDNVMITVNQVELEPVEDLSARAKSGKVQLTWTALDGAECYNVYRGTVTGVYDKIADCHITDYCTYLDLDVTNGVTYYYVVTSVAAGAESLNSNEVSATPQSRRRR